MKPVCTLPLGTWLLCASLVGAASANPASPLTEYQACLLREAEQGRASQSVADIRLRCLRENTVAVPPAPAVAGAASRDAVITFSQLLQRPREALSLVEQRAVSEVRAAAEPFALLPHRPNYLLPVSHQHFAGTSAAAAPRRAIEAQFQVSFKFPITAPLFGNRVLPFFAYTGRSWWQVYRTELSRPFREYNHEPELFVAMPAASEWELFGWRHRVTTFGLNHQSNGRSLPESRSWNRLVAEAWFDRSATNWAAVKLWARVPERAKTSPSDNDGDDNPDITRYLGHGELRLGYVSPGGHHNTLMLRRSLQRGGKGALQFDWSLPTGYSPSLRWTATYFDGYGDSLIDYNVRLRRVGIGIMLNDWF